MEIKKIQNAEVENKKVLLRLDFNVAIEDGKIGEKFRIEAAKESVKYLLEKKAKVALAAHLGRPEGKVNQEFSLEQLKKDAEEILGVGIKFIPDCLAENIQSELEKLGEREILLLENVRFYEGEEKNDEDFAKKLAAPFEIFVNDAFSVCHRDQASVTGVTKFLESYGGIWLQKEIENMEKVKNNPEKPAVAIIGGAKIETKLPVIQTFEKIYDFVLVGGKIANEAIDQKIPFSEKVILPFDFIDDRLDIGPETIAKFSEIIKTAKTIVWNGPMGKFEEEKYAIATQKIFEAVISSGSYTLVGGGETLQILEKNGAMEKISFVSTGGGAMLEYLSGNKMPGIEALKK